MKNRKSLARRKTRRDIAICLPPLHQRFDCALSRDARFLLSKRANTRLSFGSFTEALRPDIVPDLLRSCAIYISLFFASARVFLFIPLLCILPRHYIHFRDQITAPWTRYACSSPLNANSSASRRALHSIKMMIMRIITMNNRKIVVSCTRSYLAIFESMMDWANI